MSEYFSNVEVGVSVIELQSMKDNCKCGGKLDSIEGYPHDNGYTVNTGTASLDNKQWWLYRTCLECGYRWSLTAISTLNNAQQYR